MDKNTNSHKLSNDRSHEIVIVLEEHERKRKKQNKPLGGTVGPPPANPQEATTSPRLPKDLPRGAERDRRLGEDDKQQQG